MTFPQSHQHIFQGSNKLEKDVIWDGIKPLTIEPTTKLIILLNILCVVGLNMVYLYSYNMLASVTTWLTAAKNKSPFKVS